MFIRQVKKKNAKKGKVFYQYQLVQASRIDGKVRQNQILYLGSEDELNNKSTRQEVVKQLQTKIFGQPSFLNNYSEISTRLAEQYYKKYLIKYNTLPVDNKIVIPTTNKDIDFQSVDIKNLSVSNNKTFGSENLCKQIAAKLDLSQ